MQYHSAVGAMLLQTDARSVQDAILAAPAVVSLPRLQQWRRRVSLSQRELAKLSGVAASTIARIESGEQAHPSTVRKLAAALGCEPFDLMESER